MGDLPVLGVVHDLPAQDRSFVAGHPGNIGRLTGLVATATRIAPQVANLTAAADW